MNYLIKSSIFCVLLVVLVSLGASVSADFDTNRHIVKIDSTQSGLQIVESLELQNTGDENVTSFEVWVQSDATDISIMIGEEKLTPIITGNVYTCNLSTANLDVSADEIVVAEVSYVLSTQSDNYFEKKVLYDTTFLSVSFNDKELYRTDTVLPADSSVRLLLYRPSEAPLDLNIIIAIFVLVVILIMSTLYVLRKQRSRSKQAVVESEELLTFKKSLLMGSLKEIEKKHRANQISDDTYAKLKDEYKQDAVAVMKKLEDLK